MKLEITLLQWARSPWTMLLARVATMVLAVLVPAMLAAIAGMIWYGQGQASAEVSALKPRVTAIEGTAKSIGETQVARAKDSETFQEEMRTAVSDLKAGQRATNRTVQEISADLSQTRADVGAIKLLLQGRTDTASLLRVPPELAAPPRPVTQPTPAPATPHP